MGKFDDGQDGVTSFDEALYNDIVRAFRNLIVSSGLPINSSNIQNAQAIALYAHISTFYTENGAANVYNLIPVDSFHGIAQLTNGAEVRFRAANANTGASTITVNGLGGGTPILKSDGVTPLVGGEIATGQDTRIRYNGSAWILQSLITPAASQVEVDAGVVADKYVSPSTLLGLFNASNLTTSGSFRLPVNSGGSFSEIIINIGNITLGAGVGADVVFDTAFSSAFLWATTSLTSTNDTNPDEASGFRNQTLTGMRVNNASNGTTFNLYWMAIGI